MMSHTLNNKQSLKDPRKCVTGFQFPVKLAVSVFCLAQLFCPLNGVGAMIIIAMLVRTPVADAGTIFRNWQFDELENQLEITVEAGIVPRYEVLRQPLQIVIELPDTDVGTSLVRTYSGAVRQISISQLESKTAQVVMELYPGVVLAPQQIEVQKLELGTGKTRWIFRPDIAQNQEFPTPEISPYMNLPTRLPPATFHQINNVPRVTVPPVNRSRRNQQGNRGEQGDNATHRYRDRQPTSTVNPDSLGSASSLVTQPASSSESRETIRRSLAPKLPGESPTIVPVIDFGQPLPRK